jgi:hypothetical protein
MSTSDFYPASLQHTMDESLMRYLFAAVIAVFAVAVDLESSGTVWTEPSFVVAEAQSEPAPSTNSNAPEEVQVHSESAIARIDSSHADVMHVTAASSATADGTARAAASISEGPAAPVPICEAVKAAAEEHDIPIGFFVRLLWQESRFRTAEVSSAGAQGIAQFMPQTAVEMGLKDPFDPLQAIPASARFLRKLHDQFGNLGLAAAAYNAGGGRIEKWLSRRSGLPKETQAYVKIITGHKAEAWTDEENTVFMPIDLPHKAPCEGVGGLSRSEQMRAVNVDLTPSASALVRKAGTEVAEARNAVVRKLRVAAGSVAKRAGAARSKAVQLAAKSTRRPGRQAVMRLASESGRRSSKAAREL